MTETPERPALNGNQTRFLRTARNRASFNPQGYIRPFDKVELKLIQQLEALGYLKKAEENATFGFWVLTTLQ